MLGNSGSAIIAVDTSDLHPLLCCPTKWQLAASTRWPVVHMAEECSPRIPASAVAQGFFLIAQNRHPLEDETSGDLSHLGHMFSAHTPPGLVWGSKEDKVR